MSGQWVSTGPGFEDAPVRLFCFAHAGGGSLFFRPWRAALAPDVGVLAVVLPGRESRLSEQPVSRLDELLPLLFGALKPYVDRPFALLGHSMGAIVAYEVAQMFCDSTVGAPQRLFVSGRRAPHVVGRHRPRHTLSDHDFRSLLGGLGGTPPELLERADVSELFLPTLRADFALNETYVHTGGRTLSCPVSALTGDADPEVDLDGMAQWSSVTSRDFRMRVFAGDHFYLKGPPAPVVAAVREDLGLIPAAAINGRGSDS